MRTRVMTTGYSLAVVVFIVLAVLSLIDSKRLLDTERLARQTHGTLNQLQAISARLGDLQGATLEYVTTSNAEALERRNQDVAAIYTDIDELVKTSAHQPTPRSFSTLHSFIHEEQMLTDALIADHRQNPTHLDVNQICQVSALTIRFRSQVEAMLGAETSLLMQNHSLHENARSWSIVITAGGVIALAVILIIGIMLFHERSRRRSVQADLKRFFDSAIDMLCVAGTDGFFKQINPAFTRVLGYPSAEILKRPIMSFIHDDDKEATLKEIEALGNGEQSIEFENRYRCQDGSWKWLLWNSKVDPARRLIFASARDITRRKFLEQQLIEKEAALAHALMMEQRSLKEVEKKALALERSNRELGEFAHVAAHDLQEPLRMVSAYCAMLGESYKGKLNEDADQIIALAVDGAKRMQVLISDLLVYARVDQGGAKFRHVSLQQVVESACQNLSVSIAESRARILYRNLPEVRGHPLQLTQLIQNILSNAIKYRSEKDPLIEITVASGEESWQVTITDDGIGIAPRHHERIFGMFKRLHTREQYEGTGIGLAVCRKIVSLHGGRIWVVSDVGQGSAFHFTISKSLECNPEQPPIPVVLDAQMQ